MFESIKTKEDIVARLLDQNGENILEFTFANNGKNYLGDICKIDLNDDIFAGHILLQERNYQLKLSSIEDDIMYKRGILLQRSNNFGRITGFGKMIHELSDFISQNFETDDADKNFVAIIGSSKNEQKMEYIIELVYRNSNIFGIAIRYTLTEGYTKSAYEEIAKNFPELAFDGTARIVGTTTSSSLNSFLFQLYMMIGRATVESYCRNE